LGGSIRTKRWCRGKLTTGKDKKHERSVGDKWPKVNAASWCEFTFKDAEEERKGKEGRKGKRNKVTMGGIASESDDFFLCSRGLLSQEDEGMRLNKW